MTWKAKGFPGGSDGKIIHLQRRRLGLDPWVGKILWRREWQPTAVFLPGEFHGKGILVGYTELSNFHSAIESIVLVGYLG